MELCSLDAETGNDSNSYNAVDKHPRAHALTETKVVYTVNRDNVVNVVEVVLLTKISHPAVVAYRNYLGVADPARRIARYAAWANVYNAKARLASATARGLRALVRDPYAIVTTNTLLIDANELDRMAAVRISHAVDNLALIKTIIAEPVPWRTNASHRLPPVEPPPPPLIYGPTSAGCDLVLARKRVSDIENHDHMLNSYRSY
jgi:hypothetical protein